MNQSRRLAALMFTDMVGYSSLAREDEHLARELVDEQRAIVRRELQNFRGTEIQTTGDGFFIEFASSLDAVECAVAVQTQLHEKNRYLPEERRIRIRIGIHIGEVFADSKSQGDRFGNNVNIAARLEPMARPGGICISRQVYDQVGERLGHLKFKRIGRTDLKNIRGGAELYHVLIPQMETIESQPSKLRFYATRFQALPKMTKWSLASLFAGLLMASLFLVGTISIALTNVFVSTNNESRHPASNTTGTIAINLDKGWEYRTSKQKDWQTFEVDNSWKYADLIQGPFELRIRFMTNPSDIYSIESPTLVLGLIREQHKVYLNQNFIGGADRHTDLQYYPFPKSLLKSEPSSQNEIIIQAHTRKTLNPGLSRLSDVGIGIGDFHTISAKVRSNILSFQILRNLYFGISLIVLAASTLLIAMRRLPTGFYYLWAILLFSTCQLAYFSPWINETFDYQVVRFLKVIGVTMAGVVVLPAFSRLKKWPRLELLGNVLVSLLFVTFGAMLFDTQLNPSEYISRYNAVLAGSAILATAWLLIMISTSIHDGIKKNVKSDVIYRLAHLTTSAAMISSMLVSLKAGQSQIFVPETIRRQFVDLSLSYPLLFSFFVVGVAIHDYIKQSKAASSKRKRDSLILEASHLISKGRNLDVVIGDVQRMICNFLEAEKSAIYLFDKKSVKKHEILVQEYSCEFTGNSVSHNKETRYEIPADRGVIGYALNNHTALNISDIRADSRFNSNSSPYLRSGIGKYSSGACMIIPLSTAGETVGVITFSDQKQGLSFTQEDFETAAQVSTTLSLLFESRRLSAS